MINDRESNVLLGARGATTSADAKDAAKAPRVSVSLDSDIIAHMAAERARVLDRVARARAEMPVLAAGVEALTKRYQMHERRALAARLEAARALVARFESGDMEREMEREVKPYREFTRNMLHGAVDPDAASAAWMELQTLPDPEASAQVLNTSQEKSRRGRKKRAYQVMASKIRARHNCVTGAASSNVVSTADTAADDGIKNRRRERIGTIMDASTGILAVPYSELLAGQVARRSRSETLREANDILEATPVIPPLIADIGAASVGAAWQQKHEQYMRDAPATYTAEAWPDHNAIANHKMTPRVLELAERKDRVRRELSRWIGAGYDMESVRAEFVTQRQGAAPPVYLIQADFCETCQAPMEIVEDTCMAVCTTCKRARAFIQTAPYVKSIARSKGDATLAKKSNSHSHFDEFVARFQGKAKPVDDSVLMAVGVIAHRMGAHRKEMLNMILVYQALEILKAQKIYNFKVQIYCRLTGTPPPRLSPDDQATVCNMMAALQKPWERIARAHSMQNDGKRKTFPVYDWCMYKFVQLLGWNHMVGFLVIMKCERNLRAMDDIWRAFCQEYGWEFIPTLLTLQETCDKLRISVDAARAYLMDSWGGVHGLPGAELVARIEKQKLRLTLKKQAPLSSHGNGQQRATKIVARSARSASCARALRCIPHQLPKLHNAIIEKWMEVMDEMDDEDRAAGRPTVADIVSSGQAMRAQINADLSVPEKTWLFVDQLYALRAHFGRGEIKW